MPYTPTNWKDLPNKETPINADNLNKLEQAVALASAPVSYNDLTNKPTLLTIGTTATTAKAGNYAPTLAEIPSLPTSKINSGVFAIAQIPTGTTATTVALGNHTHTNATTSTAGFMSNTDKTKLDGLSNYTLPLATTSTIGGVKKVSGVEDTSGEDLLAVKNTLNELLANLREAGVMT